jgi:hypothetical protein
VRTIRPPPELRGAIVKHTRGDWGLAGRPFEQVYCKILDQECPLIDGKHWAVYVRERKADGTYERQAFQLKLNEAKEHLVGPLTAP